MHYKILSLAMTIGYFWTRSHKLPDGGIAYGHEKQDTSSPAAIASQSEKFLTKTLHKGIAYGYAYSFNQPSSYKYSPSQWLWGKPPYEPFVISRKY